MAAISPEKLNELMLKARKGATSSFTLPQVQAIVEAIGGKMEPFVGLVPGIRRGDRNAVYADSPAEAQAKYEALKKLRVSSPPSKPKPGVMYVLKLDEPAPHPGASDVFEIDFDSVTGAPGVRMELGGKRAEILPGVHHIQEARDYLEDGPRKPSVYVPDVMKWLLKETDWTERVNAFLGLGEHVPADARTRDRTGSCPVCFQNVKLAPGKNSIVLHGYKRPGYGMVQGKCYGVGFLPFELSPDGTAEYLAKVIEPGIRGAEARVNALKADDVSTLSYRNREVKKGDPAFEIYLRQARDEAASRLEAAEAEREIYQTLVQRWKERPLPKEGERHIDWFIEGRRASAKRVAARVMLRTASLRIARVAAMKTALDTKKWGPFTFEIDRPKGFKKEWPQADGSVKKYTYPVDYGYFIGHTGEDDEGLDAFVGEDPEGKIECFLKMKPGEDGGLVPDETKFLIGLTDEERKKVLGLYKPEEIVGMREFDDVYELVATLHAFKDRTAAVRVASRYAAGVVRG